MEKGSENYWFNYRTGQYELRHAPTSDDEAVQLIPQHPGAQGLYRAHRELGGISFDRWCRC